MAECYGWQNVTDGKMSRMDSPEGAIYRVGALTLPSVPFQRAMYLTLKGLFSTRSFGPNCHWI